MASYTKSQLEGQGVLGEALSGAKLIVTGKQLTLISFPYKLVLGNQVV